MKMNSEYTNSIIKNYVVLRCYLRKRCSNYIAVPVCSLLRCVALRCAGNEKNTEIEEFLQERIHLEAKNKKPGKPTEV